ncbi:MAG TPA: response regulator transcription factor [Candidatus Saccharimonadales bacterium]|nr:response regulator transcription factor [Candidatus Saccharimonadales bacterium]
MATLTSLLLIEDSRTITEPLTQALRSIYEVDLAASGEIGLQKAGSEDYGAIILELALPDQSGLAVCEELRNRGITAPILVISNDHSVLTKIKLLDAGADDYLTKPFSLGELKARLRVLHRRNVKQLPVTAELVVGDLRLDRAKRQASRNGVMVDLRRKEFAILECLMLRAGTVVNRDTLVNHAWEGQDDNWTNTIDVHIKYLRDKIDRPFGSSLIKTVHGLGYRLDSADSLLAKPAAKKIKRNKTSPKKPVAA